MDYKDKYEDILKTIYDGELHTWENARQEDVAHKIVLGHIRNLVRQEKFYRNFYEANKDKL